MPNDFYVAPLGGLDLGGAIARGINMRDQRQDRKLDREERDMRLGLLGQQQGREQEAFDMKKQEATQQQQEMERRQGLRGQFAEAVRAGDAESIAILSAENPEFQEQFDAYQGHKDDSTRATRKSALERILMGGDIAAVGTDAAEKIRSYGGDPAQTLALADMARTDPEGARKQAELIYAMQFPDSHKQFSKLTAGPVALPDALTSGLDKDSKLAADAAYTAAGGGDKGLKAAEGAVGQRTKMAERKTAKIDSAKSIVDQSDAVIDLVNRIEGSGGLSGAVGAKGASSLFGVFDKPFAGTEAADVVSNIETLEAKNFLASIKDFKAAGGAGALSDSEGKKLGAALTSLSRDQTEANFKKNLKVVKDLAAKAKRNALKISGDQLPEEVQDIGNQTFTTQSGITFKVK